MTAEEFRQAGHALIDWIADYRIGLEKEPVKAQVEALWQLIQPQLRQSDT